MFLEEEPCRQRGQLEPRRCCRGTIWNTKQPATGPVQKQQGDQGAGTERQGKARAYKAHRDGRPEKEPGFSSLAPLETERCGPCREAQEKRLVGKMLFLRQTEVLPEKPGDRAWSAWRGGFGAPDTHPKDWLKGGH